MAENCESIQYNKDELTAPDFLNEEFLQNVLRTSERDKNLTIKKFNIIPGTKAGDHFGSIMYKVIVSYISKDEMISGRSLVVKTTPFMDGLRKDFFKQLPVFDREINMYTKVLPEMKRIMESIGDRDEIAPRLIYHSTKPLVIIFEDITKFGYTMNEDFFGFENTVKIVEKLAKFHALSFYINDNKYDHKIDLTKYNGVMLTEKSVEKLQVFVDGLALLKEEVKMWPGYEKYAEKIEANIPNFLKTLLKVYKPNPEPGFNVICHGDLHIKNMMFLKNGEEIEKIFFLDFQLSFWASPAIDLLYVLYEIGDFTVRRRRGEIIALYHKLFTDYLNRLGCLRKGPTLLDLNIDLLRYGRMEILLGLCFLPLFYLECSNFDMELLIDPSPEGRKKINDALYKNPKIKDILKEIIPPLVYKGILE